MKPAAKIAIIAIIIVGGYFGLQASGLLDKVFKKSVTVASVDLPTAPENAATAGLTFAGIPSSDVSSKSAPQITINVMAWNAQLGLMFANGGKTTTEGSLMEKNGVKLNIVRQDNIGQASQDLIKFAQAYSENPSTATGVNMFAVMGDGSPSVLASLNKELKKIGDDYRAVIIGSAGRSNGEDALMAPVSWKENPQNAKGGVVSTVLRDGDFNIVLIWASNNAIKINPDETTYDPEAINFIGASDNVEAGEKYITQYSEERPVVLNGKKTGKKHKIQANAVSVWTPTDVTVSQKRGGLVRIVSTKEFTGQMPNTIITVKKWAEDNRQAVEGFLLAMTQGGDQVKSFSPALDKAGDISASVYNEQNGAYWVKYAKGVTESDKQGLQVDLGGSVQFNLADNLNTFGLAPNSTNTFGIVYSTFGKIYKDLYPEIFEDKFAEVDEILDLSYLRNLQSKVGATLTGGEIQKYNEGDVKQVIATKAYTIEFATGSSTLTPSGIAEVEKIYDALIIANGLSATIEGHSDNVGGENINLPLSEARANSIKTYLQSKASANFPDKRITTHGYGSTKPIADNSTEAGRAKNRRVTIIMGR